MKYYTIDNNKKVIYAGNVNDGKNDIVKYYVRQDDTGDYREFENHDSNPDFRCFEALKTFRLQTFATLEQAKED